MLIDIIKGKENNHCTQMYLLSVTFKSHGDF